MEHDKEGEGFAQIVPVAKIMQEERYLMNQFINNEEREKRFAEDIWLNYFNHYLWKHETITEKEYQKMTEKIAKRSSKLRRDKSAIKGV